MPRKRQFLRRGKKPRGTRLRHAEDRLDIAIEDAIDVMEGHITDIKYADNPDDIMAILDDIESDANYWAKLINMLYGQGMER